jgi:dTDP-4-dehydrorhamnose 3,5-epimerase
MVREELSINGVFLFTPKVFPDERGSFSELYRREQIPNGREEVQWNYGRRKAGNLVGLHYHMHQSDLWFIPFGVARVVMHDLRTGSPTEGETIVYDLGNADFDSTKYELIYIPPGVAHGFGALTDMGIMYLVDGYYNPKDECGVAWDDPTICAAWGIPEPTMSDRDLQNPLKTDLPDHLRPYWGMRT